MQETLTILILTVHIGAVNLASAGPLVGVWLGLFGWADTAAEGQSVGGQRLIRWSLLALVLGMLLGGVLLLVAPGDGLWEALTRFPGRTYWVAGSELLISLVSLAVLAAGWPWLATRRWLAVLVAAFSSTNLLYHFPPLMGVLGLVAADRHWTGESTIEHSHLLELIQRGEVFALAVHFTVASFAVAGVAALALVWKHEASAGVSPQARHLARRAAGLAAAATVLQVPIGIWMLAGLATTARVSLMGGQLLPSLAFLGALSLTILLLQRLLAVVWGECERHHLREAVFILAGILFLMTASLRLSRSAKPHAAEYLPAELPRVLVAARYS